MYSYIKKEMNNAVIEISYLSCYKWICYSRLKWEVPQNVQFACDPVRVAAL
jgi:hypothetical protein